MPIILFLLLLFSVLSVIPLWNFENSAFDLLSDTNTHTYEIYSKIESGSTIKLEKAITKNEGSISEKNIIYVDSFQMETNWEGIESVYKLSDKIYICPKGKNHMNVFNNDGFTEMKSNDFTFTGDWELICYYQINKNFMFVGYLNGYNLMYVYKFSSSTWVTGGSTTFYNGLFDFKWTTDVVNGREYPMKMIIYNNENNYLYLKGTIFTLESNNEMINRNDCKEKILLTALTYMNAYFDNNNEYFYFITYDKEPANYQSGYFTEKTSFGYTEVDSLTIITNTTSPLDFYYDFIIQSMTFNRNTKYVLYKIKNNIKEKVYYGIIDIISNKVIFNTDEVINVFKPYSYNSFLAITDRSAYKICALSDGSQCISSCDNDGENIYIDSQRPNFCGSRCSKYMMVPTGICVDECDQNIFQIKDNYFCGFCKDINTTHPYKLLNHSECYSNIPQGTYLYNSKFNLLKGEEVFPTTIPIITTIPNIHTTIIEETKTILELCKRDEDLYPANYGNNKYEIKCFNKNNINPRIYFDPIDEDFKPCYETCLTCVQKGNKTYHNCITCEPGYRLKPEGFPINNCVADCPYYYYSVYGQYKCIENLPCPREAKFLIKEKNKCINDCKKDDIYKYQYNGYCYKECPEKTIKNNYLCKDENEEIYTLTKNDINLNYTSFIKEIDNFVNIYSTEFSYTSFHVTEYKSNEYDAIIYKDKDCLNELSLDFPSVNFGNCYDKVKSNNNITEDLIIVVINKNDELNNPMTSYSFFDPLTGEKLKTDECHNDTILVVENIKSFLNENITNYKLMLELIDQGINIFNISDEFYTNLCYDYKLDTDKDIALQDRIKLFYPNISLCDLGCSQVSVDLINMTANCECHFNDISTSSNKDKKSGENALIENLLGDVLDFIDKSNIAVGKCVKKSGKLIFKSYGAYITLNLLVINITFSIIFYLIDLNKIKIYIYNNTQNYLKLIYTSINIHFESPPKKNPTKILKNSIKSQKNEENIIKFKTKSNRKNKNEENKKQINIISNEIEAIQIKTPSQCIINTKDNLFQSSSYNNNIYKKAKFHKDKKEKKEKKEEKKKKDSELEKCKTYFDEYFDTSVDEMEYDDAIIKDERKFFEYFIDKLKDDQIICYTFISFDPLKPRSIKIILFVLNFLLYFVINALFINDDYVSEVYNLEGKDHFFSFIPRSIDRVFYATLINIIIGYIVDFFFVEENKLKRIYLREKDNKNILEEQIIKFLKNLEISYISFTIFVFIIFCICFYYLICFNSIYPKMQIEWIKSSIFIFLIIQIISILQCLLEAILRFMSFYFKSERIFKVSKLIN